MEVENGGPERWLACLQKGWHFSISMIMEGIGYIWAIYFKSLTWMFRPFWGSDSLTIHYHLRGDYLTIPSAGSLVAISCRDGKIPEKNKSSNPSQYRGHELPISAEPFHLQVTFWRWRRVAPPWDPNSGGMWRVVFASDEMRCWGKLSMVFFGGVVSEIVREDMEHQHQRHVVWDFSLFFGEW